MALQGHWHARLAGRIDTALENGEDLKSDIVAAYEATAAELPGLRRLLDRYADHPALRRAHREEARLVAVAAGVASQDTTPWQAAALGAAISAEGRSAARRSATAVRAVATRPRRYGGAALSAD